MSPITQQTWQHWRLRYEDDGIAWLEIDCAGALDAEHAVPDRPVHQRCISRAAAFGLIALERGGGQIHQRQNVTQPR